DTASEVVLEEASCGLNVTGEPSEQYTSELAYRDSFEGAPQPVSRATVQVAAKVF
ncbi:MAG: hypothetical protein HRT35_34190, partial [Algicola sp.]|nr:hypothetical protein [Algicola sp.]